MANEKPRSPSKPLIDYAEVSRTLEKATTASEIIGVLEAVDQIKSVESDRKISNLIKEKVSFFAQLNPSREQMEKFFKFHPEPSAIKKVKYQALYHAKNAQNFIDALEAQSPTMNSEIDAYIRDTLLKEKVRHIRNGSVSYISVSFPEYLARLNPSKERMERFFKFHPQAHQCAASTK